MNHEDSTDTRVVNADAANLPAIGGQLEPGDVIGHYEVKDVIAAGGFGTVYRVEDKRTGTFGALKLLRRDKATSKEIILRFHREAHVLQLLDHPNLVKIIDFGVHDDGRPYFVMEYLKGVPLGQHIRKSRRLPPEEALGIFEALCTALHAAHAREIIHRDIKSSNVFISENDDGTRRVVLLDFGVAKLYGEGNLSLTSSRHTVGTPASMAPEQIRGKKVDERTDVYALGNLAFHMLTGKLPFFDESPALVQHLHLHVPVPRPSALVPLSREIDEVILTSMQKDPAGRYGNAIEFLNAFRKAVLGGETAVANQATPGDMLAFFAEVFVSDEDLEDPDDSLLDDLDAVLPAAEQLLKQRQFECAMSSGNSLLMVRQLPAGPNGAQEREEAVRATVAVSELVRNRQSRDERVHVNLCLHVAAATADHPTADAEASATSTWAPKERFEGLLATEDAVRWLEVPTKPVDGATGLHRVGPNK